MRTRTSPPSGQGCCEQRALPGDRGLTASRAFRKQKKNESPCVSISDAAGLLECAAKQALMVGEEVAVLVAEPP